jgi:hypothetical protein
MIAKASLLILTELIFIPAALANEQIGLAAAVRNDVSQIEPKTAHILVGDDVVRDEVVRTSVDSDAKFVLRDDTNLMLGPNSRLKLDKTVFSDESTASRVALTLATGTFRFITGHLAKDSYEIKTPLATIGIRGTILDFRIERFRNAVVLRSGQAHVCAGGNCVELLKIGDTAVITATGARIEIRVQGSSSWTFDGVCKGSFCNQLTFAEAEDAMTTGSIGGGGGGAGGGGPTALGSLPIGGFASGIGSQTNSPTPNRSQNLLTGAGLGGAAFVPQSVSPH